MSLQNAIEREFDFLRTEFRYQLMAREGLLSYTNKATDQTLEFSFTDESVRPRLYLNHYLDERICVRDYGDFGMIDRIHKTASNTASAFRESQAELLSGGSPLHFMLQGLRGEIKSGRFRRCIPQHSGVLSNDGSCEMVTLASDVVGINFGVSHRENRGPFIYAAIIDGEISESCAEPHYSENVTAQSVEMARKAMNSPLRPNVPSPVLWGYFHGTTQGKIIDCVCLGERRKRGFERLLRELVGMRDKSESLESLSQLMREHLADVFDSSYWWPS